MGPAYALRRLKGLDVAALTHERLIDAPSAAASGTAASTGIGVGRVAFGSESAMRLAANGEPVILVRPDTSTVDVAGFAVATGILTAAGGRTAHAALVARQMGKPCVVGCAALSVDAANRTASVAGKPINGGDWLTIDGETGAIYLGQVKVAVERPDAELAEIERWRNHAIRHEPLTEQPV